MNQPLKSIGYTFAAPVNSTAFSVDASAYAFGLGDGSVEIFHDNARRNVKVHSGAVPALYAYDEGFISLSDDGTLKTIATDGTVHDFADFKGAWTEKMAVHVNGSVAVAVGRHVHLWTRRDAAPKILGPHEGSVTDIHFAPDGMGLAASHRDGVTLWAWPHFEPQPMRLAWKGAHLAVTISSDKRWVVTAMQEGAIHLWNVPIKRDYQMSGYQTKPTRMVWSADRKWLGTSGAETVVIWPFDKQGPEGREPIQLGWSNGAMVTALAAHHEEPVMAAGFGDGAVILLDLMNKKAFNAAAPSGHIVTTITFAPTGGAFLAGTAQGGGVLFTFDS